MDLFSFQEGGFELLDRCNDCWELFITNQTQDAGEMSDGIEEYIHGIKNGGLLDKTKNAQLHVQLVNTKVFKNQLPFALHR